MGKHTEMHYARPSYTIENDAVKIFVSVQGGMTTAVYKHGGKDIFPYFINPWWDEAPFLDQDPIMQNIRGDYFCFPFGANMKPYDGIEYRIHGRTANECWDFKKIDGDDSKTSLHLTMDLVPEDGEVEKIIQIRSGEPVMYTNHIIRGFSGKASFGNHPNIQCSEDTGTAFLDMTPPIIGFTAPAPIDIPENKGYSLLKPGVEFSDETKVPTVYGNTVDLTRYPIPRGYEDVVMYISDQDKDFTFTALSEPKRGFLYFQLKDPKVLASTLLWMPNNGRYSEPMNGRVIGVIAMEEVTGNFFYGRTESVESNPISDAGHRTYGEFSSGTDTNVKLISGTIPIEPSFQGVKDIVAKDSKTISIIGKRGEKIDVFCSIDFLN